MSMLFPLLWPAWLANPAFLMAIHVVNKGRSECGANLAALAFALGFFGVLALGGFHLWGPGYWVWIGSMAFLSIGAVRLAGTEERTAAYPVGPNLRPAGARRFVVASLPAAIKPGDRDDG